MEGWTQERGLFFEAAQGPISRNCSNHFSVSSGIITRCQNQLLKGYALSTETPQPCLFMEREFPQGNSYHLPGTLRHLWTTIDKRYVFALLWHACFYNVVPRRCGHWACWATHFNVITVQCFAHNFIAHTIERFIIIGEFPMLHNSVEIHLFTGRTVNDKSAIYRIKTATKT